MGKAQRRHEPRAAPLFRTAGSNAGRIVDERRLEGGELVFLDARTALSSGYRTNAEGIRHSGDPGRRVDDLIPCPCRTERTGRRITSSSLLAPSTSISSSRTPVFCRAPFRQWLLSRGTEILEVPDEEFASMGCNVLATAPGRCVILQGNPPDQRCSKQPVRGPGVSRGRRSLKGRGGDLPHAAPRERVRKVPWPSASCSFSSPWDLTAKALARRAVTRRRDGPRRRQ